MEKFPWSDLRKNTDQPPRRREYMETRTKTNSVFRYSPLSSDPGAFRLLRLKAQDVSSSRLAVDIFEAKIADFDPDDGFLALSYCWGRSTKRHPIIVNGCPLERGITATLLEALVSLLPQDGKPDALVWADAICINQADSDERARQVSIMREIYSAAETVVIHLGLATDKTELAFATLRELCVAIGPEKLEKLKVTDEPREDIFAKFATGIELPETVHSAFQSPQYTDRWLALIEDFICRNYWDRLWVVQEIALSRDLELRCGREEMIPWETFVLAFQSLVILVHHEAVASRFNAPTLELAPGVYPFVSRMGMTWYGVVKGFGIRCQPSLGTHTQDGQEWGSVDLLDALYNCTTKKCNDPRDMVYGILGLVHKEQRRQLQVNYSAPLSRVFTETAELIIETSRRLDVICHASCYPLYNRPDGLPSWVPDWGSTSSSYRPLYRSSSKASGGMNAEYGIIDSEEGKLLSFKGIRLGKITNRSIHSPSPTTAGSTLKAIASAWLLAITKNVLSKGASEAASDDGDARESPPRTDFCSSRKEFCKVLFHDEDTTTYYNWGDEAIFEAIQHACQTEHARNMPIVAMEVPPAGLFDHNAGTLPYAPRLDLAPRASSLNMIWNAVQEHMACFAFFILDSHGDLGGSNLKLGKAIGIMSFNDVVCVPLGCSAPVILRRYENGRYRFVCDAYIPGYMNGEAVDEWKRGERGLEDFLVV